MALRQILIAVLPWLLLVPGVQATVAAGHSPPMGWCSWNAYHAGINASVIVDSAHALKKLGLVDLGYTRVNIDGGWEDLNFPDGTLRPCAYRNSSGYIRPNPKTFPDGLEPVAAQVKQLGLQFGMYLPFHGCPDAPSGPFGHTETDIKYCLSLGATMLKVDALHFSTSPADTQKQMVSWRQAIDKSGASDLLLSNCHMGCMATSEQRRGGWASWCPRTADMWRTSNDISADWTHVLRNLDTLAGRGADAGPLKGWNDPDILEVGVSAFTTQPLTLVESTSHFSLWCATSSPLLLGLDLRHGHHTDAMLAIVMNKGAIDVNQRFVNDGKLPAPGYPASLTPALVTGDRVFPPPSTTPGGGPAPKTGVEVWAKAYHPPTTASGSPGAPSFGYAVVLFNRGDHSVPSATLDFKLLPGGVANGHSGHSDSAAVTVTASVSDILNGSSYATAAKGSFTSGSIPAHGSLFLHVRFTSTSTSTDTSTSTSNANSTGHAASFAPPKIYRNSNNVHGQLPAPKASTDAVKYLGSFDTLEGCQSACTSFSMSASMPVSNASSEEPADANTSGLGQSCTSFTWHHADFTAAWAKQCYGHVDNVWKPVSQQGIDSGLVADPNACSDDMFCSLNGICNGTCDCFPQWTGKRCQKLNLLPVHPYSGRMDFDASTGANVSSWGGSVLQDDQDEGLWHMWSAEMAGHCGIGSWLSNSVIVYSTSRDPLGRFERKDVVFPVFSHEPIVVKAEDGSFVMYFTSTLYNGLAKYGGDGYPFNHGDPPVPGGRKGYCSECVDGSTPAHDPCGGRNWSASLPTYMSWTKTPSNSSSWSTPVAVPHVQLSPLIDSNLAPLIHPNGSLFGLWRNDDDRGSLHIAYAEHWKRPETYVQIGAQSHPDKGVEDPFIWRDKNGHYHCLTHGRCGFHSFSKDGFSWSFAEGLSGDDECAFPKAGIHIADGTTVSVGRRERPHVHFAKDGVTPIALTTAVSGYNKDASYTLLQPIGQTARASGSASASASARVASPTAAERGRGQAPANATKPRSAERARRWATEFSSAEGECQQGGNQFQLASHQRKTSAVLGRTGLEGLVAFANSSVHHNYNADDFSVVVKTASGQTAILESRQDTTSDRPCALMAADCFNATHASFTYWCATATSASTASAGPDAPPRFQVLVYYALPTEDGQFVQKRLVVCQLDAGGGCDGSAHFQIAKEAVWDGLHQL